MKNNVAVMVSLGVGLSLCGMAVPGWADETVDTSVSPPTLETQQTSAPTEGSTEGSSSTQAQEQAQPESQAQPAAQAEPSASAAVESSEPATQPAAAVVPGQEGLISVDFKDADIRQVLRIISLKAGVDVVAGADVEGLVTIKLTNVPWEQALDIILRTYGFTYVRKGTIVRVLTVAALEQEALATEVFPLDYAKAKEVPDIINEMLSERGRVKFDERTNTIIVTDIPSSLFQIREVIARLDQRTPQVLVESKIVETKLENSEKLGIDWSDDFTLTQSQTQIPSTFPFKKGTSLGSLGSAFFASPAVPRELTAVLGSDVRTDTTASTINVGIGTLTGSALSWTLNALKSRTDTHIVSNPSVAVLNNQKAVVHIGEEYPIPNYSIDPSTGNTTISGYTAKNVGTVLTVTPHVNPSSEIVVDLKPEVISVGTAVTFTTGSSSVSLPRFTTQTAQTQVRIKSGETIAIGGLVKTSEANAETKVPLLGDLPIVGLLFTNRTHSGSGSDPVRQDLLIFLTVSLMEEAPPKGPAVAAVPAEAP